MTVDELKALRAAPASPKKRNKYGARKTGGHASKKEHQRASQLRLMQRAGLISNLREQVPFLLIPAHRFDDGSLEHSCRYVADFVYTDTHTGQTIVEDTKGYRTPDYIIKRKLMLYLHGIRIKEI